MAYVLIVDDDIDFSGVVADVLQAQGHEVHVETDTEDAIPSMEKRLPDLAILDVMFPENDRGGFELARAIRYHPGNLKDIPILMLTAVNSRFPMGFSERDIDKHWLPVSDFIEKPVDLNVLKKKVHALLSKVSV